MRVHTAGSWYVLIVVISICNMDRELYFEQISVNYREILERIDNAAKRSGRSAKEVLLVAVSKYSKIDDGFIEGLIRMGTFDFAENRSQYFLEKFNYWSQSPYWNSTKEHDFVSPVSGGSVCAREIRWHFIGNLQRNKVRRIVPRVSLIHSVDSFKLIETLEKVIDEENELCDSEKNWKYPQRISVLLEVNISKDETKHGFTQSELLDVLPRIVGFKRVNVCGLMGMAGLTATPDETRRQFSNLRETFELCRSTFPEFRNFCDLSMGMSGDFEIAIEEGATIVRIGSALYPR